MTEIKGMAVDFDRIRNRHEQRVINLLEGVLDEFPLFSPNVTDIEDIFALTLNRLPARYVQPVTLVIDEPVGEEAIKEVIRNVIITVIMRPNH